MKPVFVTPRLIAREMTWDDLAAVARMLADPEVMRHYPHPLSVQEAEVWVTRAIAAYAASGHGRWLILDRESHELVGQVGLIPRRVEADDTPEVVWMIDRPYWRRGFATEAARATIDLAFKRFGYRRVIALVRPENQASVALALALGMTQGEPILHADLVHHVFRIDAERWNPLTGSGARSPHEKSSIR